nr:MAG TPA: hypothetical protein [Caudoviricetes sp.]
MQNRLRAVFLLLSNDSYRSNCAQNCANLLYTVQMGGIHQNGGM